MRIGIVGVGMVGGTLSYGFTRLGHDVVEHDVKLGTKIDAVLNAPLVFVCVPTPQADDGSCDWHLVRDVVVDLSSKAYRGLIVIKSTVLPGATDRLAHSYPRLRLAFCPEFLREKSAYSDFVENHDVCIIGAYNQTDFDLIKMAHGSFPKSFVWVQPIEAEIAKYFSNTLNAARIVFANQFFEICEAVGADYTAVKNAVAKRSSVGDHYLDCNKNFRAFGGACLPKDTAALAAFVRDRGIDAGLFAWILAENEKIKEEKIKERGRPKARSAFNPLNHEQTK
jgi:UDPglucose 6-dehydrogenase